MESQAEIYWRELAEQNWSKPTNKARKVRTELVKKEIWDVLEKENFEPRSLSTLENLQLLERYLWPGYDEESSNFHALLIALMVTVKRKEGLPVWDTFKSNPEGFSSLFRRILSMSVDNSVSMAIQNHLLAFFVSAYQSLDSDLVRKECAPLVSISIWHHLENDQAREARFEEHGQLRKVWRTAARKYDAADETAKVRLQFERSWLYTMILNFVNNIYSSESLDTPMLVYCERFVEFLTDLESQLPTRRYVNTLIQNLNLLALIQKSPAFNHDSHGTLRDLFSLLRHFALFTIDDHSGDSYSNDQAYELHCARLARLQRTALKHFKSRLTLLALANYGSIDQRPDLESHLSKLTDSELAELCSLLGLRTSYSSSLKLPVTRELLLEVLLAHHERRRTYQQVVKGLSVLPTDDDLYEPSLLRNESYNGSRPLAFPKLNLQYLTTGDFLWRSFILYRCESFYEIRKDLEETLKRVQPRSVPGGTAVRFEKYSKMALPIPKPGILEIAPPKVGQQHPAYVRAEVVLDVSRLTENVRLEWESLKPDDVIFLLSVKPGDDGRAQVNGHSTRTERDRHGLQYLRAAEIVKVLQENGRPLREMSSEQQDGYYRRPRLRRLIINIDARAFVKDNERKGGRSDVYDKLNVIVRRQGRENNFKRVLESIQSLTLSDVPVPGWFEEVFLGYGHPASASYTHLDNRLASIDFRGTFLNWQHLKEALPGKTIEPAEGQSQDLEPPYVLDTVIKKDEQPERPAKKRKRDGKEAVPVDADTVKVSTYRPPNNGPYINDVPKTNKVRFTPTQVEAIISGTQPGLTVVVGPPGTGKTDVATQIINNIYHDFPQERTLMIAHSNQALNQLFQKITQLDIDGRHLLRLGHGEEDLETDVSYGKHGRVESFLDNRGQLLAEVDRMAVDLGAPGAHGNSCETAGYFESVYVTPALTRFWSAVESANFDGEVLKSTFPFYNYFSNAPQPLFPPDATNEKLVEIARGCHRHIDKIFSELEDIRPFEILRSSRDRANYLLIKEARIIAMTSTHAAMRRKEIADLGFHYDNVIMEEAAQITEIENFIPLTLQHPKNGALPLQRIVLCGDHLQNSPIVQNPAFGQYANLEQSLFQRLVRLGVPAINLDQQGRARPSIAELYRWRYQRLGDLPTVLAGSEHKTANAGFRYDYQFIDVPDYKGTGEMQPSPHFIQNLGEAEYAVAIYQYMRLLGYPASKISILTTYAGQRALIRDVLGHRCAKNCLFGLPRIVTTVDKYQGEQNDCKSSRRIESRHILTDP